MTVLYRNLYPASEAAFWLRLLLGNGYAWEDRLADMRRGKVKAGPILLPFGMMKAKRCQRPVYAGSDIRAFVIAYRQYDKSWCPAPKPVAVAAYDVTGPRGWKVRKLAAIGPARA